MNFSTEKPGPAIGGNPNNNASVTHRRALFLAGLLCFGLSLTGIACKSEKKSSQNPDIYCKQLKECFDECNRRYPPEHGSNEIEICLNGCIRDSGDPENCPELKTGI